MTQAGRGEDSSAVRTQCKHNNCTRIASWGWNRANWRRSPYRLSTRAAAHSVPSDSRRLALPKAWLRQTASDFLKSVPEICASNFCIAANTETRAYQPVKGTASTAGDCSEKQDPTRSKNQVDDSMWAPCRQSREPCTLCRLLIILPIPMFGHLARSGTRSVLEVGLEEPLCCTVGVPRMSVDFVRKPTRGTFLACYVGKGKRDSKNKDPSTQTNKHPNNKTVEDFVFQPYLPMRRTLD